MLRNFRFSVSTCIRNSGILNYRSEIINRTLLVKSPPRAWLSTSQQLKQKNLVSYREIETFSFSTKEKQFKIYVRDVDAGSFNLKISEIWNGRQNNVYVNKSALKTFISSIKMVSKQKERVTFPNMIIEKYDKGRRKMIMEYLGDRKGSYAIKILERKDGKKDSKIILPEEGITDMIGFLVPIDIDNGTDYREIETFSFSTKKEKFKIYVREDDRGELYLKISEITNGRLSNIYVEKSALKTFISSIEMVAKQKERVTFPNRNVKDKYDDDRTRRTNMSMEYLGDRTDYREIETFSFSTKKEKFKIYVREEDSGSLYLKISGISNNGKQSNVYVNKSELKTFISSIEMVAKQKEGVTFPSGSIRNISMEYYGGRNGYNTINIHDRGDGWKGSQIFLPMDGISNMIGYCKDILNGTKEHQSS